MCVYATLSIYNFYCIVFNTCCFVFLLCVLGFTSLLFFFPLLHLLRNSSSFLWIFIPPFLFLISTSISIHHLQSFFELAHILSFSFMLEPFYLISLKATCQKNLRICSEDSLQQLHNDNRFAKTVFCGTKKTHQYYEF